MTSHRRRLSVMSLLVMVVTGAATSGNAQDRDRATSFPELFAIQQNNRMKMVYFDDGQDETCPLWNSLIHGAGDKFEIIIPTFALLGMRGSTTGGAGGSRGTNSKDVAFWNEQCKYRLSLKKIVVRYGTEVEVPLYRGDQQWLE